MKVIIPAAGKGTRLLPHTLTKPKPILPIGGKTIIDFIIDSVKELDNVDEIIFIVGYLKDEMISHIKEKHPNINASFINQDEYKGLAHAVSLTEEKSLNADSILIILGDTLFKYNLSSLIENNKNSLGVSIVDDPSKYGVAVLNENKKIIHLIEKPSESISNLALTGLYYIKDVKELFSSIDYIISNSIKTKNEFQITDALEHMITKKNIDFTTFTLDAWYDCGEKKEMLKTNQDIIEHNILTKSLNYTVIIPPVFIDESVIIEKSVIGPYVHIGKNSNIKSSIISNSILFDNTNIENALFDNSIISENVSYKGNIDSVDLGNNS